MYSAKNDDGCVPAFPFSLYMYALTGASFPGQYIYVCIYMYICICMYIFVCMYMYVCMYHEMSSLFVFIFLYILLASCHDPRGHLQDGPVHTILFTLRFTSLAISNGSVQFFDAEAPCSCPATCVLSMVRIAYSSSGRSDLSTQ